MAPTQAGLNGGGDTTNFTVWYEATLSTNPNVMAAVVANANALLAVLENEFTVTTGRSWFGTPAGKFGTSNRQRVNLNLANGGGANNSGYGSAINCDAQAIAGSATTAGNVQNVFMAEWVEILESITGKWNAGDSSGEGLSQFGSILRFQTGHYVYYGSWVNNWLNGGAQTAFDFNSNSYVLSPNAARSDWVNNTFTGSTASGFSIHGDSDTISFGCALAFLFYLNIQLGLGVNQIIANYNSNLTSIYKAVTKDSGDPFPFFLNLISSVFPATSTASIPGPVTDNPFPIALVTLGGKSTFGLDEAKDIIDNQGGLVAGGLWMEVTGLSKQAFNALNVTATSPFTGNFATLKGVSISPNPEGPQFQAGVSDFAPQTIQIPFDLTLSSPFTSQTPGDYTLTGSLTFTDNFTNPSAPTVKTVSGSTASMDIEILAGANPFFQNQDVQQNNYPYLSQDLRVFTATPALNNVPIPGGPTLTDSIAGGYQYMQNLLTYLNSNANFTNPSGSDAFNSFPDQYGENQTDSTVTPFTIDLNGFPFRIDNNYNFAVARVRLLGSSGVSGEAKDVRVFFRLFAAQTSDTDYDINSTYPSTPDAAGKPGIPLVSAGNITIPMFATGNASSQTDYAAGGPNISTIQIPDGLHGTYHYYGCFLNVYDQNNIVSGVPINTLLNSTHDCLVAEIAYDDAPIPQGASPLSWDQLAQRNLLVTTSDNPGPAESHRIPQTFDCRPSKQIVPPGLRDKPTVRPDELVIDWGTIPEGSQASIYWPQVAASDVLALATQFYPTNPLSSSDNHTLTVSVTKGLSYIPIPAGGNGDSFAGLFTVDLPPSKVKAGQTFDILVRRLSSKTFTPPPVVRPPATPATHTLPSTTLDKTYGQVRHAQSPTTTTPAIMNGDATHARLTSRAAASNNGTLTWRYNIGSFSVRIPVTAGGAAMLGPEQNTLAILRWRLQQMAPANRWHPVLQRYIKEVAGRVEGLGGDPSTKAIPPSPRGAPVGVYPGCGEVCFSGRICEVVYDFEGCVEGFVLDVEVEGRGEGRGCDGSTSGEEEGEEEDGEERRHRHRRRRRQRVFKVGEKRLREPIVKACEEKLEVTVVVEERDLERVVQIRICY